MAGIVNCRYCDISIIWEWDRWADAEVGGVYDYCSLSKDEKAHAPIWKRSAD